MDNHHKSMFWKPVHFSDERCHSLGCVGMELSKMVRVFKPALVNGVYWGEITWAHKPLIPNSPSWSASFLFVEEARIAQTSQGFLSQAPRSFIAAWQRDGCQVTFLLLQVTCTHLKELLLVDSMFVQQIRSSCGK